MCYQIETMEHVLLFKINRPEKRNAINYDVMDGLKKAIDMTKEQDQIKALVLTGTGSAFCSGGDIEAFHSLRTQQEAHFMLSKMGAIIYELATLPKVTIALINGTAIGGGCELAAACDFRIAHSCAKMGFIQANLAITTGWGGGTLLYERLVPSQALHMLTTAGVYQAKDLHENGFIDYLVEDQSFNHVLELLNPILLKNVHVLVAYKQMLIKKWKREDLQDQISSEIMECSRLWEKQEHHDAVEQFLNSSSLKNTKS
ncbi:enoyl-CoA hydratase/isomerase family protein [Jeotgalibacillus sp. S-D1]|uniref:enoyl-CoA hydratase/isomerase family protein n=1 Tax=Jeotgalibacillus sp. S-D1 TaxID=2552189 RepID=UPI001F115751|nr:enoyl-CoA hydratase/isomerase family protein [Jeotgalibacillus sp. S-D1]